MSASGPSGPLVLAKYWFNPGRHNCKIVDLDVKNQIKQNKTAVFLGNKICIIKLFDVYFECSWILGRRGDRIPKTSCSQLIQFPQYKLSISTNKIIGIS